MKKFFLLLFILFASFCLAQTNKNISEKEVLSKIIPVVDKEYFPVAKKLIQEARKSIFISMFVVKRCWKVDILIEELKKAAKRGVKIKILLENNIRSNPSIVNSLKSIKNIEIKLDSPQKTTHNKIIIIDGEIILIGSTNWTGSSLCYANEANVVIKNKNIAKYFQDYFNCLWNDSSKDILPFQKFTGKVIPIIDREYFNIVKRMMSKATNRIFVMVYSYKLSKTGNTKGDVLAAEIIKAKRRGVETRILLEKSSSSERLNKMNKETIDYFKKHDVEAKFDDENTITHAKVIIIDNAVILGSTNWSYSGLEKWHNTDVLIKEKRIVKFFVNYFKEKW